MKHEEGKVRAKLLVMPTWLVVGVFFVFPLLLMFLTSFRQASPYGVTYPVEDWGRYIFSGEFLVNYKASLTAANLAALWRALWMACVTAAICLLLGYPAAYFMAIVARPKWRGLLMLLVVIPFWTSFIVRIGAWKLILGPQGMLNGMLGRGENPIEILYTPFAVLLGLVYAELPFMILPLYASLEKMDRRLLEAATDLGAGPVARFFRVTVPQTMPGIIAGLILVFIPSIGQFVFTVVLGGGVDPVIGLNIEQNFHLARPRKSALAFELTLIILLLLFVLTRFRKRGKAELV